MPRISPKQNNLIKYLVPLTRHLELSKRKITNLVLLTPWISTIFKVRARSKTLVMTNYRSRSCKLTSMQASKTKWFSNKWANSKWSLPSFSARLKTTIITWWLSKVPLIISRTNSNNNNLSNQHWTKRQVLLAKVHFSVEQAWTLITIWTHKISISMQFPACLTCQIWRATSRSIINNSLIILSSAEGLWTSIMTTWPSRTKCLEGRTSSTQTIISKKMIIPWPPFNPLNKINNRIIIVERPPHKKWQWRKKSRASSKFNALSRPKPMLISTRFSWTVRCLKKRLTSSGKPWDLNK